MNDNWFKRGFTFAAGIFALFVLVLLVLLVIIA